MSPFVNGLIFGSIFIFSLGPAFFSLVQTSVQKGLREAIFLAIGISISDVGFVVLALMGVSSFFDEPVFRMWLAIFGTVILIGYGIYSWFKKPKVYENKVETDKDLTYLKYILKGLILNGLNPFIVVFWMSIISLVAVNYQYGRFEETYFFAGVLTIILTTDLLKAFIAHRLRSMITVRSVLVFNRSVGAILVLFGIRLFYFLIENYWF